MLAEEEVVLLKMLGLLMGLNVEEIILQDYGDHVNLQYCCAQQEHGVVLELVKVVIHEEYVMEHLRRCLDWRIYAGGLVEQGFGCYQVHGHF